MYMLYLILHRWNRRTRLPMMMPGMWFLYRSGLMLGMRISGIPLGKRSGRFRRRWVSWSRLTTRRWWAYFMSVVLRTGVNCGIWSMKRWFMWLRPERYGTKRSGILLILRMRRVTARRIRMPRWKIHGAAVFMYRRNIAAKWILSAAFRQWTGRWWVPECISHTNGIRRDRKQSMAALMRLMLFFGKPIPWWKMWWIRHRR